jgi:hypothetical protein
MVELAPFFIVGCPRSGSTLLRLMLDSHPSLAIPDESHFVTEMYGSLGWIAARRTPPEMLERVLSHQWFRCWGLDPNAVMQHAAVSQPNDFASVMQTVFETYAAVHGKQRWGDKTPDYVLYISRLAKLFPGSKFIHMIRDGREVASSYSSFSWGMPTPVSAAFRWKRWVRAGQRQGGRLSSERYREVRLEQLIADPEAVLRSVCDFLGEPFAREMLNYHRTASERLRPEVASTDHRHTSLPPTPGLRDWREGLSPATQRAVEAAAQPLLRELGYVTGHSRPQAVLAARADQLRHLPFLLRPRITHLRRSAAHGLRRGWGA